MEQLIMVDALKRASSRVTNRR
ncbi:hypothetical protein [Kineococcus glutinatus]